MTAPAALAINGVTADFAAETLRDRAGNPVALRPQSFAVLRHLAANPGRLVTKDELMAAVWPGLAVTDDSLVQCIHDIRRALGDERHAVFRTVPRRGYRLVPPAEPVPSAVARPARRWLAAAAAAALVVAAGMAWWLADRPVPPVPPAAAIDGPPIVVVLPWVDLAGDAVSRVFARECGGHFLHDLAAFREFQVVGRSATYVHQDLAADGLAADFVLGGSIQRAGDRLRVTAEVTDARSGDVLWSERWDRPDSDATTAFAEISEQISNRLGGATGIIQQAGRSVAERKRPGELTAHELYLLASGQLASGTRAGAEGAAALLARAVDLDPGFARGWVELALAQATLADFGIDPEASRRQALDAAGHGVFLNPGDARAHAAHAVALRHAGDLARARSEFDTALAMARYAAEVLTLYAGWAATAGEPERGAAIADRVARLDPGFPPRAAAQFARAYFMDGRYRAALAMLDRLPADALTPALRAMHAGALAAVGRHGEAAASVAEALEAAPGTSIEALINTPGWGGGERRRLVETMRLAGLPPCAEPGTLAGTADAVRLPECAALAVND